MEQAQVRARLRTKEDRAKRRVHVERVVAYLRGSVAPSQHGVVTRADALRAGLTRRELRAQRWQRLRPGVYRVVERDAWADSLKAACLWAGPDAVISHRAAAALHGLAAFKEASCELLLPRRRRLEAVGVEIHRATRLDARDRTTVGGIPCTTLVRTLIDLAAVLTEEELMRTLEAAWRMRRGLVDELRERLPALGTRGRPGMARLRRLLDDCVRRQVPLESELEVDFYLGFEAYGLPRPDTHVRWEDEEGGGWMDFCFRAWGLAIETDGFEFHGTREAFESDAVRNSRLAALGIRVIHVTQRQLLEDPLKVYARVVRALCFDAPVRLVPDRPLAAAA